MFTRLQKIFTITCLLLLTAHVAPAEMVSKVAVVVNDAIITTHQLEKAFLDEVATNAAAQNLDDAERDKLRLKVLDRLIEEELVKDRVKELRLKVSDEDVEAAINDVQQQNKLTRKQLESALQQQGMDFETYRENLRKQILRYKLIGLEVKSKSEVTNAELREYYREHEDEFLEPPYMNLSRLTFPIPKGAGKEKIEEITGLAVEAQQRLEQGESINELLVSYATANVDGGDMGNFQPGELSERFDRAVRDLETGQVSEVVEMPNALFIFKMVERSGGRAKPFDSVSDSIEQTVQQQKQEQAFKEWNKGLRESAYIDIRI